MFHKYRRVERDMSLVECSSNVHSVDTAAYINPIYYYALYCIALNDIFR